MTTFSFFRDNELWYETDTGFTFPVPINDAQGATFLAKDKSIFFTRWIRRHLKTIEDARAAQGDEEP